MSGATLETITPSARLCEITPHVVFSENAFRRHHQRLYTVAHGILRSHADAEDAVQNAYVLALKRFDQFEGRSSFHTWLSKIVVNEALTRLRSRARLSETDVVSTCANGDGVVVVSTHGDPEAHAAAAESRALVSSILGKLPEKYRSVLVLREMHSLTNSETALRLGVSCECVKARLHRAKALFRERLERHLRACARPDMAGRPAVAA